MGERATFSPIAVTTTATSKWKSMERTNGGVCGGWSRLLLLLAVLEAKNKNEIKGTEEQFKVEQISNFIKNVRRIFRFDIFALGRIGQGAHEAHG